MTVPSSAAVTALPSGTARLIPSFRSPFGFLPKPEMTRRAPASGNPKRQLRLRRGGHGFAGCSTCCGTAARGGGGGTGAAGGWRYDLGRRRRGKPRHLPSGVGRPLAA